MSDTTFSIIIPTYNSESFIEECLDSLLGQTYRHFEIICVDDCSSDDSLKIMKEFAEKDNRLKVLEHKVNTGVGIARNTGLLEARGDYVLFVDSDDSLRDSALSELAKIIDGSNIDVVVFGVHPYLDEHCPQVEEGFIEKYEEYYNSCFEIQGKHRVTTNNINYFIENLPVSPYKLYRKSFLDRNNFTFLNKRIAHEDVHWALKWMSAMPMVFFFKNKIYLRRFREGSIVMSEGRKAESAKKYRREYRLALWAAFKEIRQTKPKLVVLKKFICTYTVLAQAARVLNRLTN